jgi:hypothetical protein
MTLRPNARAYKAVASEQIVEPTGARASRIARLRHRRAAVSDVTVGLQLADSASCRYEGERMLPWFIGAVGNTKLNGSKTSTRGVHSWS